MTLTDWFQVLAHGATILGVPIAIALYLRDKRRERRDREYGTYNALDEKYIEFLKICIGNPRLDLYNLPLQEKFELSAEEKIQQYAMFDILISIMERAFLMYRDQSNKVKKAQWEGWAIHMRDYAEREMFQQLWKELGEDFDQEFVDHMCNLINKVNENAKNTPKEGESQ